MFLSRLLRSGKHKEASFDVRFAGEVTLGDATMATWFDKDPTITGAADLDMSAAKHTRSHKSPGGAEIPVVTVDVTSAPIKLAAP